MPRWMVSVAIGLVIALVGAINIVNAADKRLEKVRRTEGVAPVLSPTNDVVENFLLVGSDSRASVDPNDPDYNVLGSASNTGCNCADSIMVLRYDKSNGGVSLLSLPRDLWVKIGDTRWTNRINTAYKNGPDVLVKTVQRMGIPVHHYIEVNFDGFKDIVDAVGGVTICFDHPARDRHLGFKTAAGCHTFNGVKALKYARSRHYYYFENGEWNEDGTSDLGRTSRQRKFLSALISAAAKHMAEDPMRIPNVMDALSSSLLVDENTDLLEMGKKLKPVATGVKSYGLAVNFDRVGDMSVVRLAQKAQAQLAYFAGTGPKPVEE